MTDFEQAMLTVRFLSVDAVEKAKSGHPGTPMALAGIAVDIYSRYLRYMPDDPNWPNRDRFVLSCGHVSALLYSILHLAGFDVSLDDLMNFRQWGSKTPGHPEHGLTPGVDTSTGPLGQGMGNAVGLALSSKMMAARVNQPDSTLIDYRVFVLASDGDMMEGVSSEASSLAGHWGLDNLIVVYDDNHITIDGSTELSLSEDVGRRYEAYGWFVQRIDGHDPRQVRDALDRAVAEPGRPSLVIARTLIAVGAPTKENSASAHGAPLGQAEVAGAKQAANWPLEAFYVAEGARRPFQARVAEVRPEYEAWQRTVASLQGERARLWQELSERRVPEDLLSTLVAVPQSKPEATRSLGGKALGRAASLVPSIVQGSADLAGSTKTTIAGSPHVARANFAGRNLHFGVREHAMGAIINGLTLSGFFLPVGSTFLVFADYMRPTIRMAALMEQPSVFVFTHDSIFVGEDGPTHQPIEQIASLRLIPNVHVVRPADGLECAAAWTYALSRRHGPTVIALTRQDLPPLERPANFEAAEALKGAYVLADADQPTLVLIATGSEVHVALGAKEVLEARGQRVRAVSAPCWEAFAARPEAERDAVLGRGIRRVAIEAGSTGLWRGVVGLGGLALGIDRFGASAPAQRVAQEFGLTRERVAERILAEL
jgi:transketolase